ncbi:hypothetical protein ACFFX0_13230 [Citricoccus parietis]|uniref:Uncharacterized protein n=1 Tax=Citricoccus parietis TaxID=592307 RepID=A0ABV5FZJ9_9MICC
MLRVQMREDLGADPAQVGQVAVIQAVQQPRAHAGHVVGGQTDDLGHALVRDDGHGDAGVLARGAAPHQATAFKLAGHMGQP